MDKYRQNIEVENRYAAARSARRHDLIQLAAFFGAAAVAFARMIV